MTILTPRRLSQDGCQKPLVDNGASAADLPEGAEWAARINQAAGLPADERRLKRRRAILTAADKCSHCAKCERALDAQAPVWRARFGLGPAVFSHGWSWAIAPICGDCAHSARYPWELKEYRGPRPCEGCGRAVHELYDRRRHKHTFCSNACATIAARLKHSELCDTRPCATCGEVFEPTRTDAKFCSGACRQLAYRRRKGVTDKKAPRRTFISRNAARVAP
jgi:hypothetical protein